MSSNFVPLHKCSFIKKDGQQCKRNAEKGSKYCWQHKNQNKSPKTKSPKSPKNKLKEEINNLPDVLKEFIIEPYLDRDIKFQEFLKTLPKKLTEKQLDKIIDESPSDDRYNSFFKPYESKIEPLATDKNINNLISATIYARCTKGIIDQRYGIVIKKNITIDALNLITKLITDVSDKLNKNDKEIEEKLENFYFKVSKDKIISALINDMLFALMEMVKDNQSDTITYYDIIYMIEFVDVYYELFKNEKLPYLFHNTIDIFREELIKYPILNHKYLNELLNIFNVKLSYNQFRFFQKWLYKQYIENKCKIDLPTYIFNILEYVNLPYETSFKTFTDTIMSISENIIIKC
jgi:hypothetical protein